jgi:hypothetical protein
VTLDIDEMVDVAHGSQPLSFWNGLDGERLERPSASHWFQRSLRTDPHPAPTDPRLPGVHAA